MNNMTILGMLLSKITKISNKIKNIMSDINSITNVNNKLHYEFTDGTNADFDVTGDITLQADVDYTDGHLKIT